MTFLHRVHCSVSWTIVSDIQYDFNEKKSKEWQKHIWPGQSVRWRRASPLLPHHVTVLCKRSLAMVTLIPGRCFPSSGGGRGGGGIGFFNNREEEPNFSIFQSSLDQKKAIGVVFRSTPPPPPARAILEPRRVFRVLL